MNYIKYTRTFVMMEEQTSEFAAREAPIKGYLKVETGNNKGALRCVVQNLKYFSRGDYIYKLILFGKKQDRTIHTVLGSLTINRFGNGETYFRFNPLDMDGKGSCYGDFSIAIVAAVSCNNEKEPLHPVLKGMMKKNEAASENRETEERDRFGVQLVMKPEEELLAAVQDAEAEKEESAGEYEQAAEAKQPEKEEEQPQQPAAEQLPDQRMAAKPPQQAETAVHPKTPRRTNYNSFYNEYLLQYCGYTCRVADYYEDVYPFENDRTGARWKRIPNVASLPLVSPGAHYFAALYRHFLFGAKPDSAGVACMYFFAVPGRFVQEEQPDGGRSGFVYWQPVVGAVLPGIQAGGQNKSEYGYWIVAVDASTGDIIEAG
ncbi:MAG: hypothetical protein QM289_07145 [Bacillota bacterium]|nr:hypothetical protein [Bacillota bacterium]NLM08910.1 hypothetical protein [Clostridiales Family XIII bacterium]